MSFKFIFAWGFTLALILYFVGFCVRWIFMIVTVSDDSTDLSWISRDDP